MTAFWHAFADMAEVAGNEVMLVRGEGVHVWDDRGNEYIDGASSLWYANVGHGNREIAAAVAANRCTDFRYRDIGGDTITAAAALGCSICSQSL